MGDHLVRQEGHPLRWTVTNEIISIASDLQKATTTSTQITPEMVIPPPDSLAKISPDVVPEIGAVYGDKVVDLGHYLVQSSRDFHREIGIGKEIHPEYMYREEDIDTRKDLLKQLNGLMARACAGTTILLATGKITNDEILKVAGTIRNLIKDRDDFAEIKTGDRGATTGRKLEIDRPANEKLVHDALSKRIFPALKDEYLKQKAGYSPEKRTLEDLYLEFVPRPVDLEEMIGHIDLIQKSLEEKERGIDLEYRIKSEAESVIKSALKKYTPPHSLVLSDDVSKPDSSHYWSPEARTTIMNFFIRSTRLLGPTGIAFVWDIVDKEMDNIPSMFAGIREVLVAEKDEIRLTPDQNIFIREKFDKHRDKKMTIQHVPETAFVEGLYGGGHTERTGDYTTVYHWGHVIPVEDQKFFNDLFPAPTKSS